MVCIWLHLGESIFVMFAYLLDLKYLRIVNTGGAGGDPRKTFSFEVGEVTNIFTSVLK